MKNSAKDILIYWAQAQKQGIPLPCPRCGTLGSMSLQMQENALSRRFDIHICASCGTLEALEDMKCGIPNSMEGKMPLENWAAVTGQPLSKATVNHLEDGVWMITACKQVHVTPEDIDNILNCAFEGVTSDWCARVEPVEGFYGNDVSEQISRGGTLRLYDMESDKVYTLTLAKMLRGIRLWIENAIDSEGVVDEGRLDCCCVDAVVADAMLQYALFDELVYS